MGIADLTGIRAKLGRAKEHLTTLRTEFDIWAQQQADTIGFYIERDGPWYTIITKPLNQPPIRFSIIAGDIIHNLRSALDHLVWQLVLRDGQKPSRTNEFPIYESEELFSKEVKFRKKPERSVLNGITIDGDAWTIIEKAQPYNSPPHTSPIGVIGQLSNVDKHRTIYMQVPFVGKDIRRAIGWSSEAVLLEERIGDKALSFEKPTEVIRYRFADHPDPNVHVKGSLPLVPTFGQGPIKGGYQMSLGMFSVLVNKVTEIVDEVSNLPRIIDVQP